jgi:hypothetical protein
MHRSLIVISCILFSSLGAYSGAQLLRENHPSSAVYIIWWGLTYLSGGYYVTLYKKISFRWRVTFFPFAIGFFFGPVAWSVLYR